MTPYETLLAESEATELPKHYREDLTTHDRAALESDDAPDAFVWILREHGTQLCIPWTGTIGEPAITAPELLGILEKTFRPEAFYIFECGKLRRTNYRAARSWMERAVAQLEREERLQEAA